MWPDLASIFNVAFAPTLDTAVKNTSRLASLSQEDQSQVDQWLALLNSSSEPKSFILDAELVAVQRGEEEEGGYKVLPFQQLSTRPRAKGESVVVPKDAVQVPKSDVLSRCPLGHGVCFRHDGSEWEVTPTSPLFSASPVASIHIFAQSGFF